MTVTITNNSSVSTGITLTGGETLTNTSSGTITAPLYSVYSAAYRPASTVLNLGGIVGVNAAINLRDGGSVANAANATISGTGAGVAIAGAAGTVSNAGTVTTGGIGIKSGSGGLVSNAASGVISANSFGVALYGGTLINLGRITSTNPIRSGVLLSTGSATITNQTSGTIAGAGNGIYATTTADTVVNSGVIQGTTSGGILLISGGAVTNQPGGTINGFGSRYLNFGDIVIHNGARWNLGGTVAAGTTIVVTPNGRG